MTRRSRALPTLFTGLLGLCLLAAACPKSKPESAAGQKVTVFASADLRGYIEPCGCSENMLGGIQRAAGQLALARKAGPVVFVDAGDALFGRTDLTAEQVPQARRKAEAIAESFTLMGLDGMAVGDKDLALGMDFVTKAGVRSLLNAGRGPETAPPMTIKDAGGVKVGIVATGGDKVLDRAKEAAKDAREHGAQIVVLLAHVTPNEAARLADPLKGLVDAIIAGHAATELDGENNRALPGNVPVLQVMSKGRSLAQLEFTLVKDAPPGFEVVPSEDERSEELAGLKARLKNEQDALAAPDLSPELRTLRQKRAADLEQRIAKFQAEKPALPEGKSTLTYRFVKLQEGSPEDPRVKDAMARYNTDTAKLNLEWAKANGKDCAPPKPGQAAYVGQETCLECHEDAQAQWLKTRHSHAYKTLEEKNKQFDLDCIRCHVVAVSAPGAVCRVDKTETRRDVQCESCHGAGSIHADDPTATNIIARPAEQNCRVCHTPENSTNFDFDKYLPKILGPGHGKPMEKAKPAEKK